MIPHNLLWQNDMSTVPASARRSARYALQFFIGDLTSHSRLRDRDFLGAIWRLTLPLLNQQEVETFLSIVPSQSEDRDNTGGIEKLSDLSQKELEESFNQASQDNEDNDVFDYNDIKALTSSHKHAQLLRDFFKTIPDKMLHRLIKADGEDPVNNTVAMLGQSLGLNTIEIRILDYLEQSLMVFLLRILFTESFERVNANLNLKWLAITLGIDEPSLRDALAKQGLLRNLGLVVYDDGMSYFEGFLEPAHLFREVLWDAPQDTESLLSTLIQPTPVGVWCLDDFPHLAKETARLREVLSQAVATGVMGVNALFYGNPGTGKTELARALSSACGLKIYQVRSADDDHNGLSREGRLSAYLLAQRLLERRNDTLLIFDEIEDIFNNENNVFAAFSGGSIRSGQQKGWMNRILENNRVPAIWITNDKDGMDPAFLRRFLLPIAFNTPPQSVRRQMAEHHLGDCQLPPALLDELAADPALTPAQLGVARQLLNLQPNSPAEQTVREGVAAVRFLLHGRPALRVPKPSTEFDAAFLNLSGGFTPSAIAQALNRQGRGNLLFSGASGTGKTLFANVLAEALDRELVTRRTSDLVSKYVGDTERNLALLFSECNSTNTMLMLDESDSFLFDRRQAQRSWERTQVNELLQQMEQFPGIFIAATNLMSGLDSAAMRRFDFKLEFRPLTPVQRVAMFAREALGSVTETVSQTITKSLSSLNDLTPGDFATVCRQRALLSESLSPEQFLRRLAAECRFKTSNMGELKC